MGDGEVRKESSSSAEFESDGQLRHVFSRCPVTEQDH